MTNDALLDDELQSTTPLDTATISRINLLIIDINEYIKFVRDGRVVLYIMCGLAIFSGIVTLFQMDSLYDQVGVGIEVAILLIMYLSCALLARKYPRASMTTALVFYIMWVVLNAVVDITSLGRGIIVKILVITYLVKAVRGAYGMHRLRDKLYQFGAPPDVMDKIANLQEVPRMARN